MVKLLAKFLSVAFHPLLMASLLFLVLVVFAPTVMSPIDLALAWSILPLIIGATVVVPLASIGMMRYFSTIESFEMRHRGDRLLPFSFVAIFYGMTSYLFWAKIQVVPAINIIFFSITSLILALTLLTFFVKVSVHSAGVWGLAGYLLAFKSKYPESALLWPLVAAILLAGMVSSARLYLDAHDSREVYLGAGLGFFISYFSIYLFV